MKGMESRGCSRVQLSTSRSCVSSAEELRSGRKREHELLLVQQAGKTEVARSSCVPQNGMNDVRHR